MFQLHLHDVDEALVAALVRQAEEHGHSVEAEHLLILTQCLLTQQTKKRSFKQALASMPYFDDGDVFDVR
jgi:plasmid stability protein